METITAGAVQYRTRCLTIEAAGRFAKCLGSNARFTGVEIQRSSRAKGERCWIVMFQPSNPERLQEMQERQQGSRAERAVEQSFMFCADKDSGRLFWYCYSQSSGETYETTPDSCSCPDATYRLASTGLKCKHSIALAAAEPQEIRTW